MRIDRYEAPNYLAKYRERQNRKATEPADDGTPLYLRRFRAKGTEVLYVDRLEGSGAGTMFHTELYRRGPGHSSSAAKAIAAYNPTMARAILEKGFERRTPFTIVDPRRYGQVLRQVRVDGFAASREEHTICLLYTSPSPRDLSTSRMPSSA